MCDPRRNEPSCSRHQQGTRGAHSPENSSNYSAMGREAMKRVVSGEVRGLLGVDQGPLE